VNTLYYGDNLQILREHIKDESVDLIYLDPPFNSNANYNVLFKSPKGERSHAQIEAFEDTWHWATGEAEEALDQIHKGTNSDTIHLVDAMRSFLGENDMMAYLAMMSVRLLELHRVLKPTGSLYLHCDPTASHYLKLILDSVFGADNFRNDIIWKRKAGRGETNNAAIRFGVSHDTILFYAKTDKALFTRQHRPNKEAYIESKFTEADADGRLYHLDNLTSPSFRPNLIYEYKGYKPPEKGWAVSLERMKEMDTEGRLYFPDSTDKRIRRKRYLDELQGETVDTLWDDIPPINSQAQERLGYPTQKPLALLQRIISASSNEGDVVLDPFCGCGTAVHAAQKLNRQWIGIDITHLAIALIEKRLKDAFPGIKYETHGVPKDLAGARDLALRDKHEFQLWATALVNAVPYKGGKKGSDTGIDGFIYFKSDKHTTEKAIVSVKGGDNVSVTMIRDLAHVVAREKAQMGIFITLAEPTKPMLTEAVKEGFYQALYMKQSVKVHKLQIITVEQLLNGARPDIPIVNLKSSGFKQAKEEGQVVEQDELPF
jgi:site-specific DNA-methyltransferase (adenine-specific)